MLENQVNTQGGPSFKDFSGTYIGRDQIVVIQGYRGEDLAQVLQALRQTLASGRAVLQAYPAQGRLLVANPDFPPITLSEQAARDLFPLAAAQENESDYLAALVVNPQYGCWSTQYIELAGFLSEVTKPQGWADMLKPEFILYEMEAGDAQKQMRQVRLEDITQALEQHPALTLLGEPGCGKTTTLEKLALQAAQGRLAAEPHKLPVLLPLADYRHYNSPYDFVLSLWQRRLGNLDLHERLRAGDLLLLFDALNEMPFSSLDEYRRKASDLRKFVTQEWPGNQAVFTCRSRDYSEPLGLPQVEIERLSDERIQLFLQKRLEADLAEQTWQRLQDSPALELVRNPYYLNMLAYQVAEGGQWPHNRAGLFKGFVGRLLKREKLRDHPGWVSEGALERALIKLAAAMQPQGEGTRLPRAQAQRAVEIPDELLDGIHPDEAGLDARLAIKFGLDATLLDVEPGPNDQEQVRFYHHQLQEYFAARALLARFRTGQDMRPYWRQPALKQEMPTPGRLEKFEPLPLPPPTGWEEPSVLAAGLAEDRAFQVEPVQFLDDLCKINPALAARCLREPGLARWTEVADAARQALLARMGDLKYHLRARMAAGLALGELGDPRFQEAWVEGVRLLLPPVVPIPAGRYPIGSRAWDLFWMKRRGWPVEDEGPFHFVNLSPFWIGRYPVTNAEFRCFWETGGYDHERYWRTEAARAWRDGRDPETGPIQEIMNVWQMGHSQPAQILSQLRRAGYHPDQIQQWEALFQMEEDQVTELFQETYGGRDRSQPGFWEDGRYNNAVQPVVGVTWHEALAYCAWLEEMLPGLAASEGFQPDDWPGAGQELLAGCAAMSVRARLPSEVEWEAAAGGAAKPVYPWGNRFDPDRTNTIEGGLNRTSPVGIYPAGASRLGGQDFSGNVLEWTASLYRDYPYRGEDGREDPQADGHRVVRGGSWNDSERDARCAYRGRNIPANFNDNLGFRVVLSLARSES